MNVKKLKDVYLLSKTFTREELATAPPDVETAVLLARIDQTDTIERKIVLAQHTGHRRDRDIRRVLSYMHKDIELPCQYEDYVYKVGSKNRNIIQDPVNTLR